MRIQCIITQLTGFEGQDNKIYAPVLAPVLRKMLPDFSLGMNFLIFGAWTQHLFAVSHLHSYSLALQGHYSLASNKRLCKKT